LNLIKEAKKEIDSYSKGGPISFADLIQCTVSISYVAQSATKATFLAAAICKCGWNEERGGLLYVDLITTMTKFSTLGQQINYEPYTYPVQKLDFGKLKL
ncbi:hypothetical protein CFOL_v3_31458, partial [Cephalotus follicularis]